MTEQGGGVGNRNQSKQAWMAFSAICLMSVMWTGIQWNCMNLYAAPVVEEMGITRTQFMLVLTIPSFISAAVSLTCFGTIEQRWGLRRMLLVGGVLNTLAFVCWTFMHSSLMLYVGGTLYGMGASVTAFNSINAGVNRWFKQKMGSLVGVANTLGNLAGIGFALVIAALIAWVGWRYSFAICVVLSAISTVVCVVLYKGNPEDVGVPAMYADAAAGAAEGMAAGSAKASDDAACEMAPSGVPFRRALRSPRLWIMMLCYFLLAFTTYGLMSTLPLFMVDQGFAQMQGQAVSISLLSSAVMLVPLGALCDRLGTKWGIALCCLLMMVAAFMLRISSLPLLVMLILAAIVGAAYSACAITVGVGVKQAFGDVDFSKKLGLCSGCLYVGLAAGPALTNLAYDTTGTYGMILAGFVALGLLDAVLYFAAVHGLKGLAS